MEERVIPVEDLMDADEVFCTGTAVVVNSVGSITYQGKRYIHVYALSFQWNHRLKWWSCLVLLGTLNCSWLYQCRVEYKTGVESVSRKLYATLTGIQMGRIEDKMGWTVKVDWASIVKYSLCWKLVDLHTPRFICYLG